MDKAFPELRSLPSMALMQRPTVSSRDGMIGRPGHAFHSLPVSGAAGRGGREARVHLRYCRHCASHHWSALSAQGWTIWPAGEHAVAPQANH
jgi:hypothetical protein